MSTKKIENIENSATDSNPSQDIELPSAVSVKSLASIIKIDPVDVIKQLMRNGYMLTINDAVDPDIATRICQSYGFEVKERASDTSETKSLVLKHDESDAEYLETRPPVVTILGHVDHGKTTLLDYIRKSSIVTGEAGGDCEAYRSDKRPYVHSAELAEDRHGGLLSWRRSFRLHDCKETAPRV